RAGRALRERFLALRGWRLLVLPGVPLAAISILLVKRFPVTLALWDDWYNHAIYFTVFIYGWWLAGGTDVWSELSRLRKRSLVAALVVFAAYWLARAEDPPPAMLALVLALRSLYAWLALATILGWGYTYLNRPFRWLPFATEAVYPWYILHQSLIIV